MKDTAGNVIANALANLNSGKDVQVDKVLHLRKTEVMDLILEEILSLLEARRTSTEQLIKSLEETLYREALAYVKDYTGLTAVHSAMMVGYNGEKKAPDVGFYVKSLPVPSGRTLDLSGEYRGDGAHFNIAPSPALKVRYQELKSAKKELEAVNSKLYNIEHNKTKFKATVIRSMLQEHKEGRSLLDGIRELAEKLV